MTDVHTEANGSHGRNWLVVAALVSAMYMTGLAIVVLIFDFCPETRVAPDGAAGASAAYCMSYSEAGNLLSGIFAPLAFIWLAVAVLIQSQELRLTRQEYSDTRMVLAEQASALSENAALTGSQNAILAKNADLMTIQNEIFAKEYAQGRQERERREREQSDEKFDELIVNLQYFIANELTAEEVTLYSENGDPILVKKVSDGVIREPRIMTYSLLKAISEVQAHAQGVNGRTVHFARSKALDLHARVRDIFKMKERLSDPHAAKFAGCHITELNGAVTWLHKEVNGRSDEPPVPIAATIP